MARNIFSGYIDIYYLDMDLPSNWKIGDFIYSTDSVAYTDLPQEYKVGDYLIMSYDFVPLKAWTLYRSVANQSISFNTSEWYEDHLSPYAVAVEAAQKDGALARALADGTIIITSGSIPPSNPDIYDIWQCPASDVPIGLMSAADGEAYAIDGSSDVFFYWGIDSQWHLCTAAMVAVIDNSVSTKRVKSKAVVWNTININGDDYINGWQSLIDYQNGIAKNTFTVIAEQFEVGAVSNVQLLGYDEFDKPIYEATGESYTPFKVNTVDHTVEFDAKVSFKNSNQSTIDTSLITNGAGWTDDTLASIAQAEATTGIYNINPSFEDWSGNVPEGFSSWYTLPSKETSIVRSGSLAARWSVNARSNGGMVFSDSLLSGMPDEDYVAISFSVYLVSGTFAGAGICLDWRGHQISTGGASGSTNYYANLHLNIEIPSPQTGRWYTISKVLPRPTIALGSDWAFDYMAGYVFAHYSDYSGGITNPIDIIFDNLTIRKATVEEVSALSAIAKITDMASDNILSPVEKPSLVAEYTTITAEQSGIDAQASAYAITTEKTNYDTSISALTTYLNGLTSPVAWNVLSGDTTIVGTTFRSKFNDVYAKRQILLNKIYDAAKYLADTAQTSATNANSAAVAAQNTANAKTTTYYLSAAPSTGLSLGDLWYDTTDNNRCYRWSGSAWVDVSGKAGSGINIANAYYTDFEYTALDTSKFYKAATAVIASASVNMSTGTKSLQIDATGSSAWVFFGSTNTDYNIPISANKKWIMSAVIYLDTLNSPKTTSNVILWVKLSDGTLKNTSFSVTPGVKTRISFVADCSANASTAMICRIDNTSYNSAGTTSLYVDSVMIEEQIGTLSTPSAYVSPVVNGAALAGLINAGVTTIDGGKITADSVDSLQIKSNAVTADHILTDSITMTKLGWRTEDGLSTNPMLNQDTAISALNGAIQSIYLYARASNATIAAPTSGYRLSRRNMIAGFCFVGNRHETTNDTYNGIKLMQFDPRITNKTVTIEFCNETVYGTATITWNNTVGNFYLAYVGGGISFGMYRDSDSSMMLMAFNASNTGISGVVGQENLYFRFTWGNAPIIWKTYRFTVQHFNF